MDPNHISKGHQETVIYVGNEPALVLNKDGLTLRSDIPLNADVTFPDSLAPDDNLSDVGDRNASRDNLGIARAVLVADALGVTLANEQTIDGVLTSNSLVLLTAQGDSTQNGPWVTAASGWSRPDWFASGEVYDSAFIHVLSGTLHGGSRWNAAGEITVDTTGQSWTKLAVNGDSGNFPHVTVDDDAYGAGWNGSLRVPTRNAVYDQMEIVAALLRRVTTKITGTNYTLGTTDPNELYGGRIYVTGACTITIPAVAIGMNFEIITIGAVAVSVDPNASDLIYLDGVALDDGDKITNLSTAGDYARFSFHSADGFVALTNGWTDGGA